MSCQNDAWVIELLNHFEKTPAGDWVNTTCGLVQKFNLRLNQESQSTAELSLIATRKIARFYIQKLCQVKGLNNQVYIVLELDSW